MQHPQNAGRFQIKALRVRQAGRVRGGDLQRFDAAGAFADQLVALHQPAAGGVPPHLGDVQEPPAAQHVQAAEQVGRARQQRPTHAIVKVAAALTGRAVAQLAVAVLHQLVEQFRQAHGGTAAVGRAFQGGAQGSVQAGDARQVVAAAAQHHFPCGLEGSVAAVGQHRQEAAGEFPPVAERRPRQVLQAFRELGVGGGAFGVGDDGG